MSLATGLSLLLVLGLAALMGGFASGLLAHNRGRTAVARRSPSGGTISRGRRAARQSQIPASDRAQGQQTAYRGQRGFMRPRQWAEHLSVQRARRCVLPAVDQRTRRVAAQAVFFSLPSRLYRQSGACEWREEGRGRWRRRTDLPLRRAAPITHGRVAALREELHAFRSGAPRADKSTTRATTRGRLRGDGSHFQ